MFSQTLPFNLKYRNLCLRIWAFFFFCIENVFHSRKYRPKFCQIENWAFSVGSELHSSLTQTVWNHKNWPQPNHYCGQHKSLTIRRTQKKPSIKCCDLFSRLRLAHSALVLSDEISCTAKQMEKKSKYPKSTSFV